MTLLGLVFIANLGTTSYLLNQNRLDNYYLNNSYVDKISYLIVRAIDGANKPVVIDPVTDNAYLPDAKLVLPPTPEKLGQIVYNYMGAGNGVPAEVQIADQGDINAASTPILTGASLTAIFNAVPKAQSCTRGISIYFGPFNASKLTFTKKLANGKTLYFYTEPLCQDNNFLSYVEKINSY
jgi:hypothetical protein